MSAEYVIDFYQIDLANNQLNLVERIPSPREGFSWSKAKNDAGNLVFSMDLLNRKANPEVLRRYATNFAVRRNGEYVWVGPFTYMTMDAQGREGSVSGVINLTGREYMHHLQARRTNQIFSNTDQGQIAWGMINEAQLRPRGNLFIEQGTIEVTRDRNRKSFDRNIIFEEIKELTRVSGGINFELVPRVDAVNKLEGFTFNAFQSIGIYLESQPPLQFGTTVESISAATSGDIFNFVETAGDGTDNVSLVQGAESIPSQQAFTRRETFEKLFGVSELETIKLRSAQNLLQFQAENIALGAVVGSTSQLKVGTFNVGDILDVDIEVLREDGSPTMLNFKGRAQIEAYVVNIDGDGNETITPSITFIQ